MSIFELAKVDFKWQEPASPLCQDDSEEQSRNASPASHKRASFLSNDSFHTPAGNNSGTRRRSFTRGSNAAAINRSVDNMLAQNESAAAEIRDTAEQGWFMKRLQEESFSGSMRQRRSEMEEQRQRTRDVVELKREENLRSSRQLKEKQSKLAARSMDDRANFLTTTKQFKQHVVALREGVERKQMLEEKQCAGRQSRQESTFHDELTSEARTALIHRNHAQATDARSSLRTAVQDSFKGSFKQKRHEAAQTKAHKAKLAKKKAVRIHHVPTPMPPPCTPVHPTPTLPDHCSRMCSACRELSEVTPTKRAQMLRDVMNGKIAEWKGKSKQAEEGGRQASKDLVVQRTSEANRVRERKLRWNEELCEQRVQIGEQLRQVVHDVQTRAIVTDPAKVDEMLSHPQCAAYYSVITDITSKLSMSIAASRSPSPSRAASRAATPDASRASTPHKANTSPLEGSPSPVRHALVANSPSAQQTARSQGSSIVADEPPPLPTQSSDWLSWFGGSANNLIKEREQERKWFW